MQWRTYILDIFKTLDTHEATNDLLRKLDLMIISDATAVSNIFDEAKLSLRQILNAYLGEVEIDLDVSKGDHAEKTILHNSKEHQFYIDISQGSNEISYIRRIVISQLNPPKLPTGKEHPRELESLNEHLENAIISIGQQLNVCIKNEVSRKTSNLYRKITAEFARSGIPQNVFHTICEQIKEGFFPDIPIYHFGTDSNIRVQLLILEAFGEPHFEENDILQIIGSTEANDLAGYVQISGSVCGSLLQAPPQPHREGYHKLKINKKTIQYYIGDPHTNSKYVKTLSGDVCWELAVPLINREGKPFAVINMESDRCGSMSHLHALTLAQQSESLGELVAHIWEVAKNRNEMFRGLFSKLEEYVSKALTEFRHGIKTPQAKLGGICVKLKAKDSETKAGLIHFADEINKINSQLVSVSELLGLSLEDFNKKEKASLINLQEKVKYVAHLVAEELKNDAIDIDFDNIPNDFPLLQLDALFSQFLYDILQNSIDAIVREKPYRAQRNNETIQSGNELDKTEYKPVIKITAKLLDNQFSLSNDIRIDNTLKIHKKCLITIFDNGIGIESKKIGLLATKGNSFRGGDGTGYGLYGFKQYLSLFGGILLPFESDIHNGFTLKFVVNCIDTAVLSRQTNR